MKGLLLRLSGLDADAENAVRVIGFFDRLITARASLDTLVRTTADLAGCPVGVHAPGRGLSLRAEPGGVVTTPGTAPAGAATRVLEGGVVVWAARVGTALPLDDMLVERFAIATAILLEHSGVPRPELGDPALVELALSEEAGTAERSRALHLLGFGPGARLRVLAVAGGEVPGGRSALVGKVRAVLTTEAVLADGGVVGGLLPESSGLAAGTQPRNGRAAAGQPAARTPASSTSIGTPAASQPSNGSHADDGTQPRSGRAGTTAAASLSPDGSHADNGTQPPDGRTSTTAAASQPSNDSRADGGTQPRNSRAGTTAAASLSPGSSHARNGTQPRNSRAGSPPTSPTAAGLLQDRTPAATPATAGPLASGVRIGIGPELPAIEAARSWAAARTALRFTSPAEPAVRWEQLGTLAAFDGALTPADLAGLADLRALDRLQAEPHGEDTLAALTALCSTGSARKAAALLHRHHSTMPSRLARAEAVLRFDVDSPAGRFRLHLALMLRRLRDNADLS